MQDEWTEAPRPSWQSRIRKMLKGGAASRDELQELLGHVRWREVLNKNELTMLQGVLQVSQMQVRESRRPPSRRRLAE